ncbi:uncharacterized protein ARMOST_20288 [Armillaria ostoyae]|uniref:Uncharacterized protein n=1 Tax=Armillaria ostoyae TaxID=47428 RepID=A0A284S6Y5_ARMOS|nr:uncharacterized protein ARMOST_20288 [Armillaria ostoyae]
MAVLTERWIHQYVAVPNRCQFRYMHLEQRDASLERVSATMTLYLMRGGIARYSQIPSWGIFMFPSQAAAANVGVVSAKAKPGFLILGGFTECPKLHSMLSGFVRPAKQSTRAVSNIFQELVFCIGEKLIVQNIMLVYQIVAFADTNMAMPIINNKSVSRIDVN